MSRRICSRGAVLAVILSISSLDVFAQSRPNEQAPAPPSTVPAGQPAQPPGSGAPARVPSATGEGEYRIGPEDVLDIVVWKNAELTRTVNVRPDGRISLPLLNDVAAAGLTTNQLREALATGYKPFLKEDLEVSVVVKEIHSFKVSVLGMVRAAGRFEFKSGATVLEALAQAGGLTEFAKKNQITVFRSDGRRTQRFNFDYSNVIYDNAEQNFALRPGDIILVP